MDEGVVTPFQSPMHAWAVDQMALRGTEHVLEVGCGNGKAAYLICQNLHEGKLVALDRSATALSTAIRLNQTFVRSNHVTFLQADLLTASLEPGSFDVIFAFNVNIFWTSTKRACEHLAGLLDARGKVFLFFAPPSENQCEDIENRIREGIDQCSLRVMAAKSKMFGSKAVLQVELRPRVPRQRHKRIKANE